MSEPATEETGDEPPLGPAPLTCHALTGEPYLRHPPVEAEIREALAIAPEDWVGSTGRSPLWRLETLVHLIRLRARDNDNRLLGALTFAFLEAAKPTVERWSRGFGPADTEVIEGLVGDRLVALVLAELPTRTSEYLEIDAKTVIKQATLRVVSTFKDQPKAHAFKTAVQGEDGTLSLLVENLPGGGLDPLEHLLAKESSQERGVFRRLLLAVTDPRHREAFILRKLRNWPYSNPDPAVPTLESRFGIGERQIRTRINTAIAQMRAAHGADQ